MRMITKTTGFAGTTIVAALLGACIAQTDEGSQTVAQAASEKINTLDFTNASGTLRTYSDNPKVVLKKNQIKDIAFFTSFGSNGRTCLHCHTPGDAWGVSAASIEYRFTHPLDVTNADCIMAL